MDSSGSGATLRGSGCMTGCSSGSGLAGGSAVVEDRVPAAAAGLRGAGRRLGDLGNLPGSGIAAGVPGERDGDTVEKLLGQAFCPGVDGFLTAVLDQSFKKADDSVGALVEVFGHVACGQHARWGLE